jgi:hypothetical protein
VRGAAAACGGSGGIFNGWLIGARLATATGLLPY